jgi:hypothetical protein
MFISRLHDLVQNVSKQFFFIKINSLQNFVLQNQQFTEKTNEKLVRNVRRAIIIKINIVT